MMNFYGRVGPILRRLYQETEFFSLHKTRLVACFKTGDGKKLPPGTEEIKSGPVSTISVMGLFKSFNKENKTTKPQNTNLNWSELKDELSKMPNDKRELYMEAMIRGIFSKNSNNVEKKKFFTIPKTIVLTICSVLLLGCTLKVNFPLESESFNSQKIRIGKNTVTFDDVKGLDEAKADIMEIVEHLRKPEKYIRLGGKLPKGLMLIGPTGTGKTFLARAIAGEANVPFFYKTGSEFNEALAGEGVEKIRELFRTAKRNAPCIIFIDEIDSICSEGVSKDLHPYANTTINQLLREMDGFENSEGIIVIGATNKLKVLDKALLKTGRFDIHINCSIPDLSGRIEIFKHYLDKVPHRNIDIDVLAKTTIGFSAADISNVVNQAALKAATEGCHHVLQKHLEDASDRMIMGPARIKGRLPDKESNRITAYHEAGHTLVALYTPYATPLHKVTIIPRQKSLGNTSFMPEKDKYHTTKAEILAQIDVLMGGRAAEELIFGKDLITTGASDDLEKATLLANEFIMEFGINGDITLRRCESDIVQILNPNLVSPQAIEKTNIEIDKIMNESYARAKSILTKKAKEHKRLAEALLEYGTLTAKEVQSVIEGKPLKKEPTENLSGVEMKRKTQ